MPSSTTNAAAACSGSRHFLRSVQCGKGRQRRAPARLEVTGDGLGVAQDPEGVGPRQLGELALGPAAIQQLGQQPRVSRDILESVRLERSAVVVAAEADVVHTGNLANVLDVVGDLGDSHWRPGWSRSQAASSTAAASSSGSSPVPVRCSLASADQAAQRGETNGGTKVTMQTPPLPASAPRISSGTLRGTSHNARADEWEKITGAAVTRSAARIVAGATWLRSTSMPSRLISRTTSSPKRLSPPARGWSVAESAHGTLSLWVSVR